MGWNYEQLLTEKFEDIEKAIFAAACQAAREMTVQLLMELDEHIMHTRDMGRYKNKEFRKTTIKTVYGEVEYNRRLYYDNQEDDYVFLLEEALQMEKIGTVSANLAKRIVEAAADMPYRKAAELISQTTGQSISSHGVWDVVQSVGTVIGQEEEKRLDEMEEESVQGKTDSSLIFMEADGVYLKIQKNKKKAKSQELKLATIYSGWSEDGKKLVNKKVIAGMEPAEKFNKKTEALLQSTFNIDSIQLRILNGDGAEWISNTYNPERVFQLDRFHIYKKIRECVRHKSTCGKVLQKMKNRDYEEMFSIIQCYIDSIDDGTREKEVKKAKELYQYLSNNYDGLPRWQEQAKRLGVDVAAPENMTYKNMGVQENQNCSLITNRMKGRKMRWSENGANNLAKIICTRENGDLDKIIEKLDGQIILPDDFDASNILTPSKIKETVGKGSKWVDAFRVTIPVLSGPTGNFSDALRAISF